MMVMERLPSRCCFTPSHPVRSPQGDGDGEEEEEESEK